MWFPVEMLKAVKADENFIDRINDRLITYPHSIRIIEGKEVGQLILMNNKSIMGWLGKLRQCDIAYVGYRNAKPKAPFCGFNYESYECVRIELLIDAVTNRADLKPNNWFTDAVSIIVDRLFQRYRNINKVMFPETIPDVVFPGFIVRSDPEGCCAVRHEQALSVSE